ncbi:monocarboxylate permease [Mycena floridula]|nr:monocarboxylate permease [Mycena floridula]
MLNEKSEPETGTTASNNTDLDADYPDGGLRAWLVVSGSFMSCFSTWGIANSYGVFKEEYAGHQLQNDSSSTISLIGSLQLALLYGCGPFVGRLFDVIGIKILAPLGTITVAFSLIMLSLCQDGQTYQFFLTHGVLFGIGSALVFTPSLAIVGHWFHRRRGFALSIVAAGSSLGGVIYPILLKTLIPKIGFPWSVRAVGLLTLFCMLYACLCMRTRLVLKKGPGLIRESLDFTGFRDVQYCLVASSAFLLFYAMFIPYFYIESYARDKNLSSALASNLVAILNASGTFRILLGLVADRIGALNTLIPSIFLAGILIFSLWLPSTGPISITIFCSLFGLLSGSLLALLPAYVAAISPSDKFGGRLGAVYLVVAVATLVGTPTAGAFDRVGKQPQFVALISFTGALILGGGIILLTGRLIHSRHFYVKI